MASGYSINKCFYHIEDDFLYNFLYCSRFQLEDTQFINGYRFGIGYITLDYDGRR